jgi:hypothetical protein
LERWDCAEPGKLGTPDSLGDDLKQFQENNKECSPCGLSIGNHANGCCEASITALPRKAMADSNEKGG